MYDVERAEDRTCYTAAQAIEPTLMCRHKKMRFKKSVKTKSDGGVEKS